MTEMIDQKINLFFNPSVKGLSLLSENPDWQNVMEKAVSNPGFIKSRMKAWAAALEVSSLGISDRERKLVWDYWSDKPVVLNPGLSRDKWFFDFWIREKIPDWTFTLYKEDSPGDYQLYVDRLIRDLNSRPIGSIAAKIPLVRLKEGLENLTREGERVIIFDDKAEAIIDISRMEAGEGVQTFSFEDSSVKKSNSVKSDPLIAMIIAQEHDYGFLEKDEEKIFFKKTPLFNGAMSILTLMNRNIHLQGEKTRLRNELIILFALFTIFIGGILLTMMFYTEKVKVLAMNLEVEKSRFEDLLFIITHGFGNEILLLRNVIENMPRRFAAGIDLRLSDMNLMIQNAVNAARLDGSKVHIVSKPYSFSWQWEKLTDKFKKLAEGKGQTFSASPAADCIINNDEEMVYQVLANLVSDAVKYTPVKGRVELNARMEGSSLLITVSDSGPGFSQEDREVMFKKFRKLSARPTGGERSTGLGLYVVRQLSDVCNIRVTLLKGEGDSGGAAWEVEFETVHSGI